MRLSQEYLQHIFLIRVFVMAKIEQKVRKYFTKSLVNILYWEILWIWFSRMNEYLDRINHQQLQLVLRVRFEVPPVDSSRKWISLVNATND